MSVLLVDGDNLLTIGFFGLKNHFHKGNHIGAQYHFINTLRRLIDVHRLDKVVVFWDGEEGSSSRKKFYSHYKENRKSRIRTEEEMGAYSSQRNRVKQYLEELFIRQGEYDFCESDDSIAYYTQKSNENTLIYSSDGDLTQLVSERTQLLNPSHNRIYNLNDMFVYDHEEILIQNIKLVKIMCGDPSDNIAGIKNLGVRRLITLVPEIKTQPLTLENLKDKFNILFEQDRHNNLIKNLMTGVTKHGVLGEEFYNVNKRIVSLDEPFLTEESIVSINSLMTDVMDPEGRSYKNAMKMMMEDGINLLLPKSDDAWINFLNPFLRLTRKEKNKKLIKIKNND
jgi:5'-3' exonuclease